VDKKHHQWATKTGTYAQIVVKRKRDHQHLGKMAAEKHLVVITIFSFVEKQETLTGPAEVATQRFT
jgi:hypothetical protein